MVDVPARRQAGAPIASWAADLQNEACQPSVIFIERAASSGLDEHPGNNIQLRAADVANILNELLASPSTSSNRLPASTACQSKELTARSKSCAHRWCSWKRSDKATADTFSGLILQLEQF
jgi:hypothetical protein